jgi:asparagine N-glycosylation enzyme membrane subunit Stt3
LRITPEFAVMAAFIERVAEGAAGAAAVPFALAGLLLLSVVLLIRTPPGAAMARVRS